MSQDRNKPRDPLNPPSRRRPQPLQTVAAIIPVAPPKRQLPQATAPASPPTPPPSLNSGTAEPIPEASKREVARKAKRQPTGDYPVGNCKPPISGQIKPGEVRNPRGRPRGAIGFNTIVRKTMTTKVTVRTANGEQLMSRLEASFIRLADAGFGGNVSALREVFSAYIRAVPEKSLEDPAIERASLAEDEAILAAFREMLELGEPAPAPEFTKPTSDDDDDQVVESEDDDA